MVGVKKPAYKLHDRVFAKMKGFAPWPARITEMPSENTAGEKKFKVTFYGTYDVNWLKTGALYEYNDANKALYGGEKKNNAKLNKGLWEIEHDPELKKLNTDEEDEASGSETTAKSPRGKTEDNKARRRKSEKPSVASTKPKRRHSESLPSSVIEATASMAAAGVVNLQASRKSARMSRRSQTADQEQSSIPEATTGASDSLSPSTSTSSSGTPSTTSSASYATASTVDAAAVITTRNSVRRKLMGKTDDAEPEPKDEEKTAKVESDAAKSTRRSARRSAANMPESPEEDVEAKKPEKAEKLDKSLKEKTKKPEKDEKEEPPVAKTSKKPADEAKQHSDKMKRRSDKTKKPDASPEKKAKLEVDMAASNETETQRATAETNVEDEEASPVTSEPSPSGVEEDAPSSENGAASTTSSSEAPQSSSDGGKTARSRRRPARFSSEESTERRKIDKTTKQPKPVEIKKTAEAKLALKLKAAKIVQDSKKSSKFKSNVNKTSHHVKKRANVLASSDDEEEPTAAKAAETDIFTADSESPKMSSEASTSPNDQPVTPEKPTEPVEEVKPKTPTTSTKHHHHHHHGDSAKKPAQASPLAKEEKRRSHEKPTTPSTKHEVKKVSGELKRPKRLESDEQKPDVEAKKEEETEEQRIAYIKQIRIHLALLKMDFELKKSISISKTPDIRRCCLIMEDLLKVPINKKQLFKAPEIVDTIKRTRKYGDSKVRELANECFTKFQSLFLFSASAGETFLGVYEKEREKFIGENASQLEKERIFANKILLEDYPPVKAKQSSLSPQTPVTKTPVAPTSLVEIQRSDSTASVSPSMAEEPPRKADVEMEEAMMPPPLKLETIESMDHLETELKLPCEPENFETELKLPCETAVPEDWSDSANNHHHHQEHEDLAQIDYSDKAIEIEAGELLDSDSDRERLYQRQQRHRLSSNSGNQMEYDAAPLLGSYDHTSQQFEDRHWPY